MHGEISRRGFVAGAAGAGAFALSASARGTEELGAKASAREVRIEHLRPRDIEKARKM